jgi:hypothetical protein
MATIYRRSQVFENQGSPGFQKLWRKAFNPD